jgi:hypothetical protein
MLASGRKRSLHTAVSPYPNTRCAGRGIAMPRTLEAQMPVVSHHPPKSHRTVVAVVFAAVLAAAAALSLNLTYSLRQAPPDITGAINGSCMSALPSNFSPRILDHCVAACIACEHGNRVTCSTSCRLRGAS